MGVVFTTTAGVAATIIAIIGGFVASKLITLSTERKGIAILLRDISKEMNYRKSQMDLLTIKLIKNETLDLITNSIEKFVSADITLDEAYNKKRYDFPFDEICPFWDKAELLLRHLPKSFQIEDERDENGVQCDWAKSLSEFEYTIYKTIMAEINYRNKLQEYTETKNNSLFSIQFMEPMRQLHMPLVFAERDIRIEKSAHKNNYELLALQKIDYVSENKD
jgi:hypothetical protein